MPLHTNITQIELVDILLQSKLLIPGFSKAYGFFYHPVNKEISVNFITEDEDKIQELKIENSELRETIQQLRRNKSSIEWVEESQLPFERSSNFQIQREVFDEYRNYVLLLRISEGADQNRDLLYLFFKPDASNFGLKSADNKLSTEHKSIIATLIHRSLLLFQEQRRQLIKEREQFRADFGQLTEQFQTLSRENNISHQRLQGQIGQYIIELLQKEATKMGFHLQMSLEASSFIQQYQGSISSIPNAAKQAVQMAQRTQRPSEGSLLKMEDFLLKIHFSEQIPPINIGLESIADSRFIKTIQLLNRLENAAKKVQSEGKSLSGTNIGLAMDVPISAPAISDALRKHQKKIQNLCIEYPQEWTLIKKSFKPIQNVLIA
jgi:hypothetical protein